MTQWGKTFPLSVIAVLATGCADGPMLVSSTQADLSKPIQGIPYYLPLTYIPITITTSSSKSADTGNARTDSSASAATSVSASTSVTVNTGGSGGSGGTGGASGAATYKVSVKLGAVQYTADTSQQYFLTYTQNQYADDHASIHVDQNGLLQSSSGQSTDQSAASAAKLVQLLGEIASMPFTGPVPFPPRAFIPGAERNPAPAECSLPVYTTDQILVPRAVATAPLADTIISSSPTPDWKQTDAWDGKGNNTVHLVLQGLENPNQSLDITVEAKADAAPILAAATGNSAGIAGVAFRGLRGYKLTTSVVPNEHAAKACHLQPYRGVARYMLPNDGAVFFEDTARTPLVKKQVSLTIQNGMLTGLDVDKPSEFYAGVSLPADLLKSLLAVPASVLSFRVQQVQAEQGLTDAEAKALQSQINLIQQQNAYDKAKPQ